jgi:hypothetical protein
MEEGAKEVWGIYGSGPHMNSILENKISNRHVFQKMSWRKHVFEFFNNFFWNIYHSKKKWERSDHKCMLVLQ